MTKCDSTYIKRTQRDYSLGFKLQVVSAVEKGDTTYSLWYPSPLMSKKHLLKRLSV